MTGVDSDESHESFDLESILWRSGRVGDWSRAERGDGASERFVAVPGASEIRQLLPWRWSSIVATGHRRSDDRSRSKRVRDMAGVAALLGLGAVSSRRRVAVAAAESLVDEVALTLGHEDALGIVMCGPPRANEKPVIQLHDRRGRTVAFVKVGWNELTRRLIADEGRALQRMADLAVPFVVPEIVGAGTFGSSSWLALAPIEVGRQQPPTEDGVDQLGRSIEQTATTWRGPVADACFVHDLLRATRALPVSGPTASRLACRDAVRTMSLGASHGDFVPWNILSGSPRPAVWDWERYRTAVPLGYDRLHYRIQVGLHRSPASTRDTLMSVDREINSILADLPVDQRCLHLHWYLVDIMARYERDIAENPSPLLPELVDQIHSYLQHHLTSHDL